MGSTGLIILLTIVLGIQVALFIIGRRIRKKEKESNVLFKHDIKTRKDIWQKLADPELPETDRQELEKLYRNDQDD